MPSIGSSTPVSAQRAAIPLCEPQLSGQEWTYIKECLDTNWVSSVGAFVTRFERLTAEVVGTRHAVATSSGTAALHIALLVAGVEPEDEVLVSTLTFIAPVNTIRYVGAWPVFIDAEPEYWQVSPVRVREFLARQCRLVRGQLRNRRTGRRVRAILPVHILGHPVDMEPVLALADEYGLAVIEDATESLGARYKGRAVGRLGDVGCLSFNGNKIITTGGGGMLVTDQAEWAQRARYLTTQSKENGVEAIHGAIGYNYRLTNLQAAMGCAQMERLAAHVEAKRALAQTYAERLKDVPGLMPMREAAWAFSTFWLYTVLIDPAAFGMDSRQLLVELAGAGIQVRPLWQPIHRSPAYAAVDVADCPVAERLHQTALSLPSSVGLSADDQARVIDTICAAAERRH